MTNDRILELLEQAYHEYLQYKSIILFEETETYKEFMKEIAKEV